VVPYFVALRLLALAYNQGLARRILALPDDPVQILALKRPYIVGMGAAGACWGLVGWMMPHVAWAYGSAREIVSFIVLIYVAVAALITAGDTPRAFVAHLTGQWLMALAPLAVTDAPQNERLMIVTGVLVMVLTTLLLARILVHQTLRGAEAELQRADLTESLRRANNELELALQRAVEAASRDPLTGALNRRAMHRSAEYLEATRRRQPKPCALLLLDLDHFKRVNDSYGHAAGDAVLVAAAAVLRQALREVDLVARWGGEEFLVLMPDCDQENALVRAEELRSAIEHLVVEALPRGRRVSVSIGAADWPEGMAFNELVDRADAALYRAKHAGRNRVMLAA
jgi:diguanylate cyclase (GGDEF)-like protein